MGPGNPRVPKTLSVWQTPSLRPLPSPNNKAELPLSLLPFLVVHFFVHPGKELRKSLDDHRYPITFSQTWWSQILFRLWPDTVKLSFGWIEGVQWMLPRADPPAQGLLEKAPHSLIWLSLKRSLLIPGRIFQEILLGGLFSDLPHWRGEWCRTSWNSKPVY